MLCHGENRGCCFITYSDAVKELRFLDKFLHSCRTLFRGRARVIVLGKVTAKQAVRSLKGKGVGARQGIVWFWEGWCGNPSVLTAKKFVA